jgi:hypothetical protein
MNCKDTLLSIFQYLQGKDLLNCNLVCKRWYEIGSDNHLWYECLRRSIPKEIVAKNDPRFIYRRNIHYKLFYLSYFSHRYQFMLGKDIKELWKEFLSDDYWIGKILAPLTFLPVLLIITPFGLIQEFKEWKRWKYHKEYCSCVDCYSKQNLFISHGQPSSEIDL